MWIFLFTSFMLFAALTSGFIVYTGGKGHAMHIQLPDAFRYSTMVIILSSVTMFMTSRSAKQSRFGNMRLFLLLTMVLGVLFLGIQIYGWSKLVQMGAYFVNPNASLSFIYVFTGIHLLHIVAGLLLLANTLWVSNRNKPQVIVLFKIEITSIFWHFIDIIWIYLYVFLLLNQR
jgi:cytochrome c oxidase subunit 3